MARELRVLTQQEVVSRMPRPISAAALSQIEGGRVRPASDTLQDLAVALEVPVGFFFAQTPGLESAAADEPAPYFRDLRSTSARERRRSAALAVLLSDLAAEIERYVRLPELQVPAIPLPPTASREDVEDAAETVRRRWQIGMEPVIHVVRELERNGLLVARLALGHRSIDAFSVRFHPRPLVLLTDDKRNYVRSRFDAAHELGHLVMHAEQQPGNRGVETQAHDFAASFLLPRAAAVELLPRRIDQAGWGQLAELKRRWGISMSALLRRGHSLQLLSDEHYRNAMKYMSAKGWRSIEPGDREMGAPEPPLLLERALKRIEIETGHTLDDLIRIADLPANDIMPLVRASLDQRPIIEL
jgi:Zn-dependent peptidase ImmA (M78 family)